MEKNVWIFNHYAGPPSVTTGVRHYNFAKHLIKKGYPTTVFAASTIHNSDKKLISDKRMYITDDREGVPFVYINACDYSGNGIRRLKNMLDYYIVLFKVAKHFEKPDVIIGSSVHPLACIAAIKLAQKYQCQCIVEIRDLWPESFVAYNIINKRNPILKMLYAGEKWIYKKADKLIFTMEGGIDYIIEKGWDKDIDLSKVYYINNGIDIEEFNYNKQNHTVSDEDLDDRSTYKIIYTGALRAANVQIWELLRTAKLLNSGEYNDIKFLIYGDGPERDMLEKYCTEKSLNNVLIKGRVAKKYIPYILSKTDINILNCAGFDVLKYGGSQNKLFEYLASEHPIITAEATKYSIVKKYNCGISRDFKNATEVKDAILELRNLDHEAMQKMREALRSTALEYDFRSLTDKMIKIIETGREN